ncbi:MAG TPA: MFS transporter, partial [Thermoleophilaceae bacterium]|nr:MFS transporter [Thermoleophilaceae bacterium]
LPGGGNPRTETTLARLDPRPRHRLRAGMSGSQAASAGQPDRALSREERRTLAVLSLPTLGFALTITTVTTYLPVVVSEFTGSTTAIGLLIGAEGILALFLPIVVGARSDRLATRLGGRLPFVLAGVPVMALALVLLGFVGGFVAATVVVLVFFAAYFLAYEPYRALYPDLVEEDAAGRGQSAQAVARGIGTGLALLGGGLLLAIGQPVPFIAAATLLMLATGVFVHTLLRRDGVPRYGSAGTTRAREALSALRTMVREQRPLRDYLVANALWEAALGAIKTFVVLFVTVGVGLSLAGAAGVIGAAAVFVLLGAATAGKLADRFGRERVMRIAVTVYGVPLVVPFLTQEPEFVLPLMPVIATGAGVVMALPYALLIPMMPDSEHGLLTGFYSMSRGLGVVLGPILAGVAIEISRALGAPFGTDGYSVMWLVAGALLVASVPLLGRMGRGSGTGGERSSSA